MPVPGPDAAWSLPTTPLARVGAMVRCHRQWLLPAIAGLTFVTLGLGAERATTSCARAADESCDPARYAIATVVLIAVAGLPLLGFAAEAAWARRRRRRAMVIRTESVLVRPLSCADARAVAATIDDVVIERNGWRPGDRDAMVAAIAACPAATHRAICRPDGELVGVISAVPTEGPRRFVVGFWVGPSHRRSGYASAALNGVVAWAHERGYEVVEAETAADRADMRDLLAAAGFVAGELGVRVLPDGREMDTTTWWHRSV